jgi:hypothetical protein
MAAQGSGKMEEMKGLSTRERESKQEKDGDREREREIGR